MAARADGDPDGIREFSGLAIFCFVQLESDLRQVIEFGDCGSRNLGLDATLDEVVKRCLLCPGNGDLLARQDC